MKRMTFMAVLMTIVVSASAMSYSSAKSEARYMSDRMARELRLNGTQYAAVYKINLTYIMSADSKGRVSSYNVSRRDMALRNVLTVSQYEKFKLGCYTAVRTSDKVGSRYGATGNSQIRRHHFAQR